MIFQLMFADVCVRTCACVCICIYVCVCAFVHVWLHTCFVKQEKAVKWYSEDDIDGLTTNGVFVMKPVGGFTPSAKPGVWREISVGGNVFSLRESRPLPNKIHQVTTDV